MIDGTRGICSSLVDGRATANRRSGEYDLD